uniref:Adhesion G protein-coupled receptor G3 n=1 Tax=Coturnix japonica TaxID=93934 RepID=A0A8C2TLE0_COTJA
MGKVLDDTVVGIVVGDGDISELQDPVQLTFTYQLLPHNVTPICVFWEPSKGGWSSHGCVTQPGDKETVCACDHLSFFTLLLVTSPLPTAPTLSPARFLMCLCWVCNYKQFRSEDTLRVNLGLHMNLVSSLLLLNLAFLLNSGLSSRASLGLCSALGGLTHYCLLCCFTWTALEGCHLYLLFVKVLGTYIHHYLLKLCVVGWGERRESVGYSQRELGFAVLGVPADTENLHLPCAAPSCSSRLPCPAGGGGRSRWQLWRVQHWDNGPPDHHPPVCGTRL